MPICATCRYFKPLWPGHAAICFERWQHLPWNAAVPLTTADDTCDKHDLILPDENDCNSPFDIEGDPDPLRERC